MCVCVGGEEGDGGRKSVRSTKKSYIIKDSNENRSCYVCDKFLY